MTTKLCRRCKSEVPIENFPKRKNSRDGLLSYCRPCETKRTRAWAEKNKDKTLEASRRYNKKEKIKRQQDSRAANLKKLYGMTVDEYTELLNKQGGVCAVCNEVRLRKDEQFMHVDHCHNNKQVRGILCYLCNIGLGMLGDSPKLVKNALEYLENNT